MNQLATELRRLCLAAVACTSAAGFSLEADREQAVQFRADGDSTMAFVDNLRVIEMSDNVSITQGSLEIYGDQAILEFDVASNELQRITVHGAPVRYRQQLDEEGNAVTGRSETIEIYTEQDSAETIVELTGNAEIQDSQASWRCVAITYVVEREYIPRSTGPCEGQLNGATR